MSSVTARTEIVTGTTPRSAREDTMLKIHPKIDAADINAELNSTYVVSLDRFKHWRQERPVKSDSLICEWALERP